MTNILGSIYIIKNHINTKVYIGLTKESIYTRFQKHLSTARHNGHYVLYKAILKYGYENFYIELIEKCTYELLNSREEFWISYYKSNTKYGYNMTPGGSKQGDPWNKSEVTDNIILSEFLNGLSAYMIAKKYKTSVSRVTLLLKKFNIKYGILKLRVSEDTTKSIIELYLKGYGRDVISKYLKINDTTVSKILKRNNIPTRTTKETKLLGRNLPKLV